MHVTDEVSPTLPTITIGITCHNAAATIERAVRSALQQDWPALDVLVVDDCSTDGSPEILAKILADHPRARMVRHQRNTGVAGARNTIIEHARGEFLAYFDDDDDNAPDRLSAQYHRIKAFEAETGAGLVFCYCNRNVVKAGQSSPHHVALAIGRTAPEPHGPTVADYILAIDTNPRVVWGMLGSCTMMARLEAYRTAGGFDESFRRCAELDLAIRAAFQGAHFIAVDRPLVTQYKTKSADKSGAVPLRYALLLREKHRDYLKCHKLYLASRAMARSSFHGNKGSIWKSLAYRILAFALGRTTSNWKRFIQRSPLVTSAKSGVFT